MKKIGNVVCSILSIMVMSTSICGSGNMGNIVFAQDKSIVIDIVQDLHRNTLDLKHIGDTNSILYKKLVYDKENYVSRLSQQLEKKLNEAGVFDSELEGLDQKTIDSLENASNISVQVSYTSIDDLTGEKKEMSLEEVDEVLQSNSKDIKSIAKFIQPKGVSAKILVSDSASGTSASGAVKQTVLCSQASAKAKIYCTYTASWLKEAYYRGKDVLGVTFSNFDITEKSWSCKHTATYKCIGQGLDASNEMKENPTTYYCGSGGSGIAFQVNLFGNRDEINGSAGAGVYESYDNEKIVITFNGTPTNNSTPNCKFTSDYWHLKTSRNLSPSVSVSSSGLSVSVSGGKTNEYERITNNAYLLFKHC